MKNFSLRFLTKPFLALLMILSFCITMNAQDTELPVFNDCPSDIYVTIQSQCDTVVSWVAPVDVTDNDAIAMGTLVQTSGPASGSDFTPGNYTIVYTVEDLTGNIGTCSFVVHVYGIPEEGLACAPMNLSLNEDCMTVLNPRMFLQDTSNIDCLDNYVVMILDDNLNPITDTLTQEHVGNTYMYMVGLPNSGFSCMNTVTVEDKFAPKITCENDTVGCYALNTAKLPIVEESCVGFTLIPLPELRETIDCDDDYIGRVTRRFYARDDYGNTSDTCTQVILLRRVDLSGFTAPESKTRANVNPLSCDVNYSLDHNGNPIPLEAGVPTIDGLPVYPTPVFLCNANVSYEDNNLPTNGCIKTIIRRWTVTEWWCSQELTTSVFQTIEIVDDKAPVLSCPDDMSFSTSGHDCTATVNLPQISIIDACNAVDFVSVTYDGKTMLSNGGTVEIPVGVNLVTYTARDICGNTETCSFNVTVTDQRKPVAICLQNTVVSLTNYGTAYLYADMIDKGSFDDCKLESIEIRRMDDNCGIGSNTVFGDRVQFCCEDMGTDVMVVLRATDSSGNFNECMVNVAVQNKILPKITSCPDDISITCTDYYNPEDLGATFGNITISSQCDGLYTVEESSVFDVTTCNIGTIERTMRLVSLDGEILGTCEQLITIYNPSPFDGNNDIDWPEDFEDDNLCSLDGLTPVLLDAPYNAPSYNDDVCTLLGESYEDEVFEFVNGQQACFKIIRHWIIIDWCQQNSNGTYVTWTHDQILKVTNSNAPVFTTTCEDQSICSYATDCDGGEVVLNKEATDDCTSEENLKWNFKIDLDDDGAYDITGNDNDATDEYPLGNHKIVWTVLDGCGNTSACTEYFEVKNCKAPIAIAYEGLSSSLVAMDTDNDGNADVEMVVIPADFFDKGSYHQCGYEVTISYSADINDIEKVFDCEDLGEQSIQMWVTDSNGNQSHVNTYIIIEDTNDETICPENLLFEVSGRLITENQYPIHGVHVMKMEVENESESMSDNNGAFIFENISQGTNLMIEPIKDEDYIEGVSTLDLLLIQRHILKLKQLDTPYKLLAADINNDGNVSASDLIQLRRLILGKDNQFSNNTSWIFIDNRYEFEDATNPWDEPYDKYRSIEYLYGDKVVDFVGVKVGDVNQTGLSNIDNNEAGDRNDVDVNINNASINEGNVISVPFEINSEEFIKGLQFELSLEGLKYVGLSSNGSLTDVNFEMNNNSNSLRCSWNNINSETHNIKFKLQFEVLTNGELSDMIQMEDRTINAEVYLTDELNKSPLNISFNTPSTNVDIASEENVMLKNAPNPFKDQTDINFNLNKNQVATISIFDVAGKLILEHTDSFEKGENTFRFDASNIDLAGMLYVKLKTENKTFMKKMIIIK